MHEKYEKPLVLRFNPSRYLFVYLVVLHLMMIYAFFLVFDLKHPLALVSLFVVIFSFYWQIKKNINGYYTHVLPIITWFNKEAWQVEFPEQSSLVATLRSDTWWCSFCVLLRLQLENNKKITLVILPDSLDRETFRRLRVRLNQARFTSTDGVVE